MAARDSVLILCGGVPLDPRCEHTLKWPTEEAQQLYFSSRKVAVFQGLSFLRKGSPVKVPIGIEELEKADVCYAYAQNGLDKIRYYFITHKEYVSDGVTKIFLQLDVLQTYQFDWQLPACFVEREHVSDDTPGKHLLDEGLEIGPIKAQRSNDIISLNELAIIFQTSVTLGYGGAGDDTYSIGQDVTPMLMSGVFSGYQLYASPATNNGLAYINSMLQTLDADGKTDGIVSIWMYPKALIDAPWREDGAPVRVKGAMYATINGADPAPSVDLYAPRNKKLLAYPYCYAYVYNNNGQGAIFRYEDFEGRTPVFNMYGNVLNDGVVRLNPQNHRGIANDNESGISLSGFPTCAWTQDMYKIWMAQNANTQALTISQGEHEKTMSNVMGAVGGAQAVMGLLLDMGNGGGNVSQGLSTMYNAYNAHYQAQQKIEGVMAQRKDYQVVPPQSKGVQSPASNIALGLQTFTYSDMSIRREYAERIDAYFDMYGYRVNQVKAPAYTNRPMWNYIKTVGCVVNGGFDAEDRRAIAAIFDNGVTWWMAPEIMYRYDLAAGNVDV